MGRISKGFSLLFVVILAVSSLIMVESAFAQSIPKPSVPEFTLKIVDHSYDVPTTTTTTTDPYTGKQTITTHPGYHVEDRRIEVTIKNQQFTPYSIDSKNLYYYISYKGHFEDEWHYYPSTSYSRNSNPNFILQSNSEYTTPPEFKAPSEGQMDFRVQAQIGYYNETKIFIAIPGAPFSEYTFIGELSGWSNTQTITIPTGSISTSTPNPTSPTTSASQNPTPTPTVPEFPSWTIPLLLSIILVPAGLLVCYKRQNNEKQTHLKSTRKIRHYGING